MVTEFSIISKILALTSLINFFLNIILIKVFNKLKSVSLISNSCAKKVGMKLNILRKNRMCYDNKFYKRFRITDPNDNILKT